MMKRRLGLLLAIIAAVFMTISDLDALGARGGGGRGGGGHTGGGLSHGGGGRAGGGISHRGGGQTMNRSPSMSRVSTPSQARPATRMAERPASRQPTTGRVPSNLSRPEAGTRPVTGQRPAATRPAARQWQAAKTPTRSDVQQFLKGGAAGVATGAAAQQLTRPAEKAGQKLQERPLSQSAQKTKEALSQAAGNRQDIAQNIRDQIGQDRPNRGDWFNGDFWQNHHDAPSYADHGGNWWKWATAAGVAGWLGWRANPYYYGGGYIEDGYYWGPTDQTGSYTEAVQQYVPEDYSQQAQQITTATQQPASEEWMPLGVFALSKPEETAATPNLYVQLALNKDGLIAGTYYNATTDQTYEAEGLVDKKTQKAAWKVVQSDNSPIVETGIYNLTQPEAPVQVHFADGRSQEMMLVRLNEPAAQAG